MKLTIALLALFSTATSYAASEGAIPGYLPADTRIVIGLRVRNLADSSLFKKVPTDFSSVNADWTKLAAAMGFDPLHDLDDVLIATNGKGQDAPALIVAHGNFAKLQLPAGGSMYHGVTLNQGKGSNGAMALLDETTAVLGDPALVKRAIDRRSSPSQLDPAFLAILNSLRVSYDLWGYGHVPPGLVPSSANTQGLDSIDRFQFGLRVTNGLEMEATLHTKSSQDGEKLVASARLLEAMVKMQQPSASAGKLDIRTENNLVHVTLTVPEDALLQAIEARRNAGLGASIGRSPVSASAVTVTGSSSASAPEVKITGSGSEPVIQSSPNGDTVVVTLPGRQ